MKRVLAIVLVLAALGFLAWRLGRHEAPANTGWPGYGEGEFVYVSSPLGGEVVALPVRRGDQVKAGAPLFQLDAVAEKSARDEAEETLRESQTRLDKAKLDFARAKSLREKRVNTSEDFDSAQQALLGAQHNAVARRRTLEQADWRFIQKRQEAPAAGLVYDTYYRPGEFVPAGTPVVALLPPEYMKVRFFIPEADLGKVRPGTPISIRMDGLPEALAGTVSFVSPQAEYTLPIIYSRENRGKLVFLAEGTLAPADAARLHPGAPVEVSLSAAP